MILKRYRSAITVGILFVICLFVFPDLAPKAGVSLWHQLKTILMVLPPIFILLGLFDVWVPREVLIRHMGEDSRFKGTLIAFFLGAVAAGPLYGAFPVAIMLMRKGAGFFSVLVFIGAWSTMKIPMLLFEMNSLGYRFAYSRLALNIVGILVISAIINIAVPRSELEVIYRNASED